MNNLEPTQNNQLNNMEVAKMSKIKKGIISAVVLVVCSFAFYFLYWVKTPQYSIGLIREAVVNHDVVKFEKHVNLDKLLNRAFDDVITAQGKITGENIRDNAFANGIINMLKPNVVNALKDFIISEVKSKPDENKSKQGSEAGSEEMTEGMKKKFNAKNNSVKDVSVISKTDNQAIVAVTTYDKQVDKDFTIHLRMVKLEDGTWQIYELDNLVDYFVALEKAKVEKLEALNKPIREKIMKELKVISASVSIGSNNNMFFEIKRINLNASFKNESGKDIASFKYLLTMQNDDKKILKTVGGEYTDGLKNGQEAKISGNIELNPFIDNDKAIGNGEYNAKESTIKVMEITYADGTKLARYTTLPEAE